MVTPTDCGWDWSGDYFGPSLRDHLHALGVVALNYNALEISFYLLFCEYVGYSEVSTTWTSRSRRFVSCGQKDQNRRTSYLFSAY